MTLNEVLQAATDAGLTVSIHPSGDLYVQPVRRLTPRLRTMLLVNKQAILKLLKEQAAAELCSRVVSAGLSISVDRLELVLSPTPLLTPQLRAQLIEQRLEVIRHVRKVEMLAAQLINRIRRMPPRQQIRRKDAA